MAATPWDRMRLMERELAQIDPVTTEKQRCLHVWVKVNARMPSRRTKQRCLKCGFVTTRQFPPEFGADNYLHYNGETEMFALWDRLRILSSVGHNDDGDPTAFLILPAGPGRTTRSMMVVGQVEGHYPIRAIRVATMQEATLRLFGRTVIS